MIESNKERQAPTKSSDAEPSHLARYKFALGFINSKSKVLDVPCGSGYGTEVISMIAKEVVGIDIDQGAVQHADEFFKKDNTRFSVGNAENLQKLFGSSEVFDEIVSFEGIEHFTDQKSALKEFKRLLKKDGTLIISTPRKPHGSPYHTVEFSLEEFKAFLTKEFRIEKMFGQIYTDIFDMEKRVEDPQVYKRFNFIAVCRKTL